MLRSARVPFAKQETKPSEAEKLFSIASYDLACLRITIDMLNSVLFLPKVICLVNYRGNPKVIQVDEYGNHKSDLFEDSSYGAVLRFALDFVNEAKDD